MSELHRSELTPESNRSPNHKRSVLRIPRGNTIAGLVIGGCALLGLGLAFVVTQGHDSDTQEKRKRAQELQTRMERSCRRHHQSSQSGRSESWISGTEYWRQANRLPTRQFSQRLHMERVLKTFRFVQGRTSMRQAWDASFYHFTNGWSRHNGRPILKRNWTERPSLARKRMVAGRASSMLRSRHPNRVRGPFARTRVNRPGISGDL